MIDDLKWAFGMTLITIWTGILTLLIVIHPRLAVAAIGVRKGL